MKHKRSTFCLMGIALLILGCGGGSTGSEKSGMIDQPAEALNNKIKNIDLPQEVSNYIGESNLDKVFATYTAKHFVYLSQILEAEKRDFIISLAAAQLCLKETEESEEVNADLANLLSVIYPGSSGITRYIEEMKSLGSYDISANEVEVIGCEVSL